MGTDPVMDDDVGTVETPVADIVQEGLSDDVVATDPDRVVGDDAEGSTAFMPGNMGGAFLWIGAEGLLAPSGTDGVGVPTGVFGGLAGRVGDAELVLFTEDVNDAEFVPLADVEVPSTED